MRTLLRPALGLASAILVVMALPAASSSASIATQAPARVAADTPYRVLVFSKTGGFRHASIPAGIQAVTKLGEQNNFTVTATEDAAAFTRANLAQYQAVVFLSTTGEVLDDAQQLAFERYIRSGGGYVGIHAAADTEYKWPFYGEMLGAYFQSHPSVKQARVVVEDRTNPATVDLPESWSRTDEWYNYTVSVRKTARVLARLDEGSYSGGTMGADHPTAWCKRFQRGRIFYTGGGHTNQTFAEPLFVNHLLGGIRYAAGKVQADCTPKPLPRGK